MDPIQGYTSLARDPVAFAKRHPHPFLLKRSKTEPGQSVADGARRVLAFHTEHLQMDAAGLFVDTGAFASGYWVWPVQKRAGNPYPEWISVGRATNADVVIRLSYVSKTHVHLSESAGSWKVIDQGSANGTKVRGQRAFARVGVALGFGDTLQLGALTLQFLDAAGLCEVIRRELG